MTRGHSKKNIPVNHKIIGTDRGINLGKSSNFPNRYKIIVQLVIAIMLAKAIKKNSPKEE